MDSVGILTTAGFVLLVIVAVVAINVSIPYFSWLLGFRFFGDDPGRNETDRRRRFLKRSLRGLLLMSRFGRRFLPAEENPFRKFDRHSNVFEAAVLTVIVAFLLLGLIVNHLR